ncbi:hydroxymethylbilane synthase [Georgenia halophila]|uniref:Porphobilinogen deaminase n=1 Tax=Georgenia halophila TaxID=620889 RepID=A0ABP8LFB2_9MICO
MSAFTPPATTALRIGTRGSDLALTQATTVAEALGAASDREVELVRIKTEGDRSSASLASLGGAGVFAAALREALIAGECDVAVHSLKDLPTAETGGLSIAALPHRADPRDVLCARDGWTLSTLPTGARVGTGSPRRAAQLRLVRPDLEVLDIRGNVGTRLGRLDKDLDAVVLARAGLARLGLMDRATETLEPDVMLPAPGQGALAVECRTEDLEGPLGEVLRRIDHAPTRLAMLAERAVLGTLEAGCTAPVGAHATLHWADDVGPARLELRAGVFAPNGRRSLLRSSALEIPARADGEPLAEQSRATLGDQIPGRAVELGESTALEMLAEGAAEVAELR